MSDLVTRYGAQATTRFRCLVLVPFEHEHTKNRKKVNKEKRIKKKNNRNICVTRISNPASGAKITFEAYN
jgi:hypothetical protein